MAEENKFEPMEFPEELRRSRNKLIYISMAIIFIAVFEPTSSGFLSNLSVKVTHYPHVALWLLTGGYLWFFVRYLSLLSYQFDYFNFLSHPLQSIKNISVLWSKYSSPLNKAKQELNNFLKEYPLKSQELIDLDKLYNQINNSKTPVMLSNDNPDTEPYCAFRDYKSNTSHVLFYTKRLRNLKTLALMDVAFPIILALSALTSIAVNYTGLVKLITET